MSYKNKKLKFFKEVYSGLVWNPGFLFGGGLVALSQSIETGVWQEIVFGLVFISLAIPWQAFRLNKGETI